MTIWLISDTHFNHDNIIKYCNRPFQSISEMNNTMIKNWNHAIECNDIVYHLGDFAMAPYEEGVSYKDRYIKTVNGILDRLNGKKYLLRGNHDSRKGILNQCHFEDSYGEKELEGFLLSHRPKETELINIHGHVHNTFPFLYQVDNKIYVNVSIDVIDFKPIMFDTVKLRISASSRKDICIFKKGVFPW